MRDRVVLMGVSGAGKSVIGTALAQRIDAAFVEGDDLHPAANVAKMSAGTPLDDDDRMPWLDLVGAAARDQAPVVIACSALRRRYRDRLRAIAPECFFVELDVSRAELDRRLARRAGHFMPPALLDSQLEALEPLEDDEPGVRIAAEASPAEVVEAIVTVLTAPR